MDGSEGTMFLHASTPTLQYIFIPYWVHTPSRSKAGSETFNLLNDYKHLQISYHGICYDFD